MKQFDLKRSNEPPVWLLFSAGGMISAICFPVLILILGILLPLGAVNLTTLINFASSGFGKVVLLAVTIFPMWSGMHRVYHGLHDLKIHIPFEKPIFYGLAGLYSVVVTIVILSL